MFATNKSLLGTEIFAEG